MLGLLEDIFEGFRLCGVAALRLQLDFCVKGVCRRSMRYLCNGRVVVGVMYRESPVDKLQILTGYLGVQTMAIGFMDQFLFFPQRDGTARTSNQFSHSADLIRRADENTHGDERYRLSSLLSQCWFGFDLDLILNGLLNLPGNKATLVMGSSSRLERTAAVLKVVLRSRKQKLTERAH